MRDLREVLAGKKSKNRGGASDLIAKILCVLFAFFLWFYVMIVESPADEAVIRDVPVVVAEDDPDMLAKGLSVYTDIEETVDITLSGKRRVLSRVTAEDISVTADLSGINSASSDITVPLTFTLPEGCQMVSATRYNTQINTDTVKKTLIPLVTELENPKAEYIYGDPVFSVLRNGEGAEVTAVSVEGPSSMVNSIASAVVKMDVSAKERSFTDTYTIALVDGKGNPVDERFLKKEFAEVDVTMTVEVEVILPLTVFFKQGYLTGTDTKTTVDPVTVTLLVAPADSHRTDLLVPIELDERKLLTEESILTHTLSVTVQPESAYTYKITPAEATVNVTIDPDIRIRQMLVLELRSTGGIDVDCKILDGFIENVVVCGKSVDLRELVNSDFVGIIDLSEFTEEHIGKRVKKKVTIEIDSPVADDVFVVGDYSCEIEITEKE